MTGAMDGAAAAGGGPEGDKAVYAQRKTLANEMERSVLEHAHHLPGLWWTRNVVHWAKVRNYVAPPNQFSNQKLQDVWLAED